MQFQGQTQLEFASVSSEMTNLYNILNREATVEVGGEVGLLSDTNIESLNNIIETMLTYLQSLVPVVAP